MMGKEILTESFSINPGANGKKFYLKNGIYVLTVSGNNGERMSIKIVVQ
jgi:hypothetical protein